MIKNKDSDFIWMFTSIYAPTSIGMRKFFWKELTDIREQSNVPWLIGGDSTNMLIDFRPKDRLYTWSNLRDNPSLACLDRFLCSITWEREFPLSVSKSLPRFQSDHNAIILKSNINISYTNNNIKSFDKSWVNQEDFNELMIIWWKSFPLDINDLGMSWKMKMQYLRRKFRGWNFNFRGQQKKEKKEMFREN
jgi:hypothetical protein